MKKLLGTTILTSVLGAATALADLRVVHASPDAPNVDVIVNNNFGAPLFSNAPFTGVTNYVAVPTGLYNVKVVPAGQTQPAVIDADLNIDGALDYTVAATGLLAGITPTVYVDDNTLDPNNARIRFIHLSPNAPAVDIAVANGGPVLFGDVMFRENGGYINVPAGTYPLEVRVAGTSTVALTLDPLTVNSNTVYSVFAMGLLQSEAAPLQAVVSVDAVPEPGSLALLAAAAAFALRRR